MVVIGVTSKSGDNNSNSSSDCNFRSIYYYYYMHSLVRAYVFACAYSCAFPGHVLSDTILAAVLIVCCVVFFSLLKTVFLQSIKIK